MTPSDFELNFRPEFAKIYAYHFATNAGQVTTTSGRKFVTSSVTVNGVAFAPGNGDGDARNKVLDGWDDATGATDRDGRDGHILW